MVAKTMWRRRLQARLRQPSIAIPILLAIMAAAFLGRRM